MAKDRQKDLSELLSAYLDGELDETARAEVAAFLDRDPQAVQFLNELRDTQAMLKDLPRESAPRGLSSAVVAAVERKALLGDQEAVQLPPSMRHRWGPIRAAAGIVLLVTVAGSWIFWQSSRQGESRLVVANRSAGGGHSEAGQPVEIGQPVESGELESALPAKDALALADEDAEVSASRLKGAGGAADRASSLTTTQSVELKSKQRGKSAAGLIFGGDREGKDEAEVPAGLSQLAEDDEIVMLDPPDWSSLDTGGSFAPGSFVPRADSRRPVTQEADKEDVVFQLAENSLLRRITTHDFESEQVELTINFTSQAELVREVRAVDAYLQANAFLNLQDARQRARLKTPAQQNSYLQGSWGINYQTSGGQQYVVNAPAKVLEEWVVRYTDRARKSAGVEGVALRVGKLRAIGFDQAQMLAKVVTIPELRQKNVPVEKQGLIQTIEELAAADRLVQSAEESEYFFGNLRAATDASVRQPLAQKSMGQTQGLEQSRLPAEASQDQKEIGARHRKKRAGPIDDSALEAMRFEAAQLRQSQDLHRQGIERAVRPLVYDQADGDKMIVPNLTFILNLQVVDHFAPEEVPVEK